MEKLLHDRRFAVSRWGTTVGTYRAVRRVATQLRDHHHIEFYVVSPRATGLERLSNVILHKRVDDLGLLKLYQEADILFLPLTKATANNAPSKVSPADCPFSRLFCPASKPIFRAGSHLDRTERCESATQTRCCISWQHPDLRQTMAEAARTRALELSWSKIAPQYEMLYSELIAL